MHHSDRNAHRDGFRAAPLHRPWKRTPRWTLGRAMHWAAGLMLIATAWSLIR